MTGKDKASNSTSANNWQMWSISAPATGLSSGQIADGADVVFQGVEAGKGGFDGGGAFVAGAAGAGQGLLGDAADLVQESP